MTGFGSACPEQGKAEERFMGVFAAVEAVESEGRGYRRGGVVTSDTERDVDTRWLTNSVRGLVGL